MFNAYVRFYSGSGIIFLWMLMLPLSAFSASDNEVYGHLAMNFLYQSEDLKSVNGTSCETNRSSVLGTGTASNIECTVSESKIISRSSFIGWRGHVDVASSSQVYYPLDVGFNVNEQGIYFGDMNLYKSDLPVLSRRNQFVGYRGGFGDVAIGRNDDVLKRSQGGMDLFEYLPGSFDELLAGEIRRDEIINYYFDIGLSKIGVSFTPADAYSQRAISPPGDSTSKDDYEQINAFAVSYSYGDPLLEKSHFYAALAYSDRYADYDHRLLADRTIDFTGSVFTQKIASEFVPMQVVRAVVQYRMSDFTVGLLIQQQTPDEEYATTDELKFNSIKATKDDVKALMGTALSASYDLQSFVIKGQFVMLTDVAMSYTLGLDYPVNKNAKATFFYTGRSDEVNVDSQTKPLWEADYQYLGLGLAYDF